MKTPEKKGKQEQKNSANAESTTGKSKENKDTNWDKHQQIDEEGNEVGPEDIK